MNDYGIYNTLILNEEFKKIQNKMNKKDLSERDIITQFISPPKRMPVVILKTGI